jgi:sterol desaturase/sphingolipid hydroxylase (fatty acid hydroxylase superfamily)
MVATVEPVGTAQPVGTAHIDTRTLGGVLRSFARAPQPWLIAAVLGVTLAGRVTEGTRVSWRDAVVVATLVALEPFTEWLLHVGVLHARPIRLGRRRLDLFAAVEHRRHHAEPRDLHGSLVPPRVMAEAFGLAVLLSLVWPTWGMRLTATVTYAGLSGLYEWTHFLIHSDYKPRHAAYRRLWTAHRLHHFRNERYWFGVTRSLGDRVFGTYPDKDAVPTSKGVKDLLAAAP